MIDGGWWKRNDLYCLPGKVWGDGDLTPETSSCPRAFIPGYLRSAIWRLPDASVKQKWFFSTQSCRGFRDSLLRVLPASVVKPWTPSRVTRSVRGVFQTLSVKQRRFFSTQSCRGFRDSLLRVLRASVVKPWTSSWVTRSAHGVFQTLKSPKVTHRPRTTATGCLPRSG